MYAMFSDGGIFDGINGMDGITEKRQGEIDRINKIKRII
jgi:hypothetical protein